MTKRVQRKQKKFLEHRRFLSEDPADSGVLLTNVGTSTDGKAYASAWGYAELCRGGQTVTVDLNLHSDGFEQSMRELNALLTDLHNFRDAAIAARTHYLKLEEALPPQEDE